MTRRALLVVTAICLGLAGVSPSALAASSGHTSRPFHARIHHAFGLIPVYNRRGTHNATNSAAVATPVNYHGGSTMTGGITVHTIFWAPSGYKFGTGSTAYEGVLEQYFSDVAAASTGTSGAPCTPAVCNVFTVEPQYASGTTPASVKPGDNAITYNKPADVVLDHHAYPKAVCASPEGTRTCITDGQVQAEVDRVIGPSGPRGLHNLWLVFLPSDVDECIDPADCGTNAFAGYHSMSDVHGHGVTIYAIMIDPFIEVGQNFPGGDPQGNPDAEITLNTAAHEVTEAMTDPEGTGYYDLTDGSEVGDRCEVGPQRGTVFGTTGPDNAPYNQVVTGDDYLIQEMWSNPDGGCVQGTTKTSTPLPLPQVSLTQFSPAVSGNIEKPLAGIRVKVNLVRASSSRSPVTVASGSATTSAGGAWSVTLSGGHVVGDDRDQIDVEYSGTGAPKNDVIRTGNGGSGIDFGGWTGWTALDQGSALTNHSLSLAPCAGVGVLSIHGASAPQPPVDFCRNNGVADTPLSSPVGPGSRVTVSSLDNRVFNHANKIGAMVRLTAPVGEPNAAPNFAGDVPGFTPTGFPKCIADLSRQAVICTGLVPGERYTLRDGSEVRHHAAGPGGSLVEPMTVRGGNQVSLSNGSRTLTTLHVARLKVHLLGVGGSVAQGTCSPGEYWGTPFIATPNDFFGGATLTGKTCPASGNAAGLPANQIAQVDEHSGGFTFVSLPSLVATTPIYGETMYGKFKAQAQTGSGKPQIGLAIFRAGKHRPVFRASNVDTPHAAPVNHLTPGHYLAVWVILDRNGDTRAQFTRFVEQTASARRSHKSHRAKRAAVPARVAG